MLAVNHLAPFLLTILLLDRVKESGHEALYEVKQLSAGFTPKATLLSWFPYSSRGSKQGNFARVTIITGLMLQDLGTDDEYWQREVDTLLKLLK